MEFYETCETRQTLTVTKNFHDGGGDRKSLSVHRKKVLIEKLKNLFENSQLSSSQLKIDEQKVNSYSWSIKNSP